MFDHYEITMANFNRSVAVSPDRFWQQQVQLTN